MAGKGDAVIILLMTLNRIRMILDGADEQLAAIGKREGGAGVPAKQKRPRMEYADPIMAASVRGGGRGTVIKKVSKVAPKLPKGRIGKSVKKK